MKASSRPLCRPTPRVSITLQTSIELAAELDQTARRHGFNRHQFIIQLIRQGLERLGDRVASDTTASQQQG